MPSFRYLLFNKPFQVLSQFTQGKESRESTTRGTLSDFIPVPDVYAVGRLDYDSEGLMLLTNDGGLQHRLSDPRFEHPRTYWAQVEGVVTEEAARRIAEGVLIQGHITRPCRARMISEPSLPPRVPPIRFRPSLPVSWLQLTLTEGRNRQVRRMTAAVGFPTLRLLRIAIGELTVEGLAPGCWRDVSAAELKTLRHHTLDNKTADHRKGRPRLRPPFGRPKPQR